MKKSILFFMFASILCLPLADAGMICKGAYTGTFCQNATTTLNGTTGILCEDFEGATSCYSGYSSNCRNAWTSVTGTGADLDYGTPLDGVYSANFPDTAENDKIQKTITSTATVGIYIGKINFSSFGPSAKNIVSGAYYTMQVNNVGNLSTNGTTFTVNAMSTGTTYHIWGWYDKDGSQYACFDTTTTRPDPSTSNNCSYTATSANSSNVTSMLIQNDTSTMNFVFDDVLITTTEIGNNP